jgi:UDP-N-acetylmuramoyl-tripeptide--D-alanyl-D-alanine ligase
MADVHETSCSAERPPNSTTSRVRSIPRSYGRGAIRPYDPRVRIPASILAAACDGRLVGPDVDVDGACNDHRVLEPGQLFVPVIATRDGHDFIAAALEAGAAAYLTARAAEGGTAIEVDGDTVAALLRCGSVPRSLLPDRVVGITGSVGKTSTKDLTAAALSTTFATHATPRNFNNELGLPITLLGAPAATEALVLEMGARGIGHIAELCRVGRPTIGVVTCVAAVHTEVFGTIDDVARGKGELVQALPASGAAVLNLDDSRVAAMRSRTAARVLGYGAADGADLRADDIVLDDELRPRFTLLSPWGSAEVRLPVRGAHQVGNALAAAGAALAAGAPLEAVAAGLATATASPHRMDLQSTPAGGLVIDDAYNASPLSMAAALHALTDLPGGGRRIAVLGRMAELGDGEAAAHREVASVAAALDVTVVAVGTDLYGIAPVEDPVAAVGVVGPGDAVLVKASRSAGLERVAEALRASGAS